MEKPKIDMWTADYKSTPLKLNCAKSIAAQIPSWMPLILIINLLARSLTHTKRLISLPRLVSSYEEAQPEREAERQWRNGFCFVPVMWRRSNRKALWCVLAGIGRRHGFHQCQSGGPRDLFIKRASDPRQHLQNELCIVNAALLEDNGSINRPLAWRRRDYLTPPGLVRGHPDPKP